MKKILIADDSEFIRKVLKEALATEYKAIMAVSGKQAIEKYKKEKPDLVLLDIIMPEGEEEGVQVLRKISKIRHKAVIIMITAVGQKAMVKECKKLGAKDYIIKPFDEEDVLKKVKKYLG